MLRKVLATAALWSFVIAISYAADSFGMLGGNKAALLMVAGIAMTIITWVKDVNEIDVSQVVGAITVYILGVFFPYFFNCLGVLSGEGLVMLVAVTFITIVVIWYHNASGIFY